ncbi:tyrosine-type recombinase/integrase [Candidatus Woesearchaeota archaeon]|nr:tyrosine-type recombinase/integrase [Candidatus Woesearchaeota archaeon]
MVSAGSGHDRFTFPGRNAHLTARSAQEAIGAAGRKAGVTKRTNLHTLRHSFTTHTLEDGYDVAVVQALLGHAEVRTTVGYLHLLKPSLIHTKSPLDADE